MTDSGTLALILLVAAVVASTAREVVVARADRRLGRRPMDTAVTALILLASMAALPSLWRLLT